MKPPSAYVSLIEMFRACRQYAPVVNDLGLRQQQRVMKAVEDCLRCFPHEMERRLARGILNRREKKPAFNYGRDDKFTLQARSEVARAVAEDRLACDEHSVGIVISRLAAVLYVRDSKDKRKWGFPGASRTTLDRWSFQYHSEGVAGLIPNKSTGRPRKTT
jgi:hypothetical protein